MCEAKDNSEQLTASYSLYYIKYYINNNFIFFHCLLSYIISGPKIQSRFWRSNLTISCFSRFVFPACTEVRIATLGSFYSRVKFMPSSLENGQLFRSWSGDHAATRKYTKIHANTHTHTHTHDSFKNLLVSLLLCREIDHVKILVAIFCNFNNFCSLNIFTLPSPHFQTPNLKKSDREVMCLALSPKYLVGLSFRIGSPCFKSWPEGVFHHFTQYLRMNVVILRVTRPQLLSTKILLQHMLHVFPEYRPVVHCFRTEIQVG